MSSYGVLYVLFCFFCFFLFFIFFFQAEDGIRDLVRSRGLGDVYKRQILGSIQDGLTGDFQLLAVKSLLDGFAALAFAATLGPGVILSALTILAVQGSVTLAAAVLGSVLGEVTRQTPWVIEMTATGGVLILGISLLLLDLRRVRVGNLMPAVFLAPLIVLILQALTISY